MKPYPLRFRAEAITLRKGGWSVAAIARYLGVSEGTVMRWINPEYDERQKQANRRRKRAAVGVCADCGGPTRYAGKGSSYTSKRCKECSLEHLRAKRVWTRETIIEAIRRWHREYGRPPSSTEWIRRGNGYWPPRSAVYGKVKKKGGPRPFATWNDAIRAAGFEPNRKDNPGRPFRPFFSRDDARELREMGMSDADIARRFGVTQSAIGAALGPRPKVKKHTKHSTREQRIANLQKALERQEKYG